MTKGTLLYFADGAPPALTTHTRFDFLGALRGHAKFPLITFSSLEDQVAPHNSFSSVQIVDSIRIACGSFLFVFSPLRSSSRALRGHLGHCELNRVESSCSIRATRGFK